MHASDFLAYNAKPTTELLDIPMYTHLEGERGLLWISHVHMLEAWRGGGTTFLWQGVEGVPLRWCTRERLHEDYQVDVSDKP